MKYIWLLLATFPLFCLELREKSIELNLGYRRDFINWQFQDPSLNLIQLLLPFVSTDPLELGFAEAAISNNNVYRHNWSDLRQVNVGGTLKAVTWSSLYARLQGNVGSIVDGELETSGLLAGLPGLPCRDKAWGIAWDVSGALGFQISSCDDDFFFTPLLGYAFHEIRGRSFMRYDGYWTGPYLGFEFNYLVNEKVNFYTDFEYHWAVYRGKSCGPMVRFHHVSSARGLVWYFGGNYNLNDCWSTGVKFTWVDWKSFLPGRIESEVRDGATLFFKDTSLGRVHWGSYRIEGTIKYDL